MKKSFIGYARKDWKNDFMFLFDSSNRVFIPDIYEEEFACLSHEGSAKKVRIIMEDVK